jgi:hypothetical protein
MSSRSQVKPIIDQFKDDLEAVVDRYRDQGITLGESVGAIELLKLDLWREQTEEPPGF